MIEASASIPGVLVVGAGPVGLVLACELARHGVVARVIDKAAAASPYCRAIGVTPRSLEVFEDMGVARDLIDAGLWLTGTRVVVDGGQPRDVSNDLSDLPFAPLLVPQDATEAVLERHLQALGGRVERGAALVGLSQDGSGVEAEIETAQGRERARFRYVVGCDGAHSAARRSLGIGFEGEAFPMTFMLGDVRMDAGLPRGLAFRAIVPAVDGPPDFFVAIPLPKPDRYRVSMMANGPLGASEAGDEVAHGLQSERPGPPLADLQEAADRLVPGKPRLSDLRWSSRFRISMRLADRYRSGAAFIAGDACHIHPPTGGQGMNTGVQDAYNLAWKLALVARGRASSALLDSYEAERRPVAAEVIARTTEESVNLGRPRTPPHRLQDTQLLVEYRDGPLSAGDAAGPLAPGDRAPDAQGLRRRGLGFPLRLFDLLRGPRFTLIVSAREGDLAAVEQCAAALDRRWPDFVRVIAIVDEPSAAQPLGVELVHDAVGRFAAAYGPGAGRAWLARPDGYLGLIQNQFSPDAAASYLTETIGLLDWTAT